MLLPCIGPSKAHDLDEGVLKGKDKRGSTEKAAKSSSEARTKTKGADKMADEKEKEKEKEKDSAQSSTSAKRLEPIDTTRAAGFVPVVPSQHTPTRTDPSTPIASDPAIIVPPTPPSHILPKDETGGMTSGAVQPPGSTGEESRRSSRHGTEYGGESGDGSGEDEDEDGAQGGHGQHGQQHGHDELTTDEDDEEERLIREGGAGIPIGPVSPSL